MVGVGGTSVTVGSGAPTPWAGCLSGAFNFAVPLRFTLVFFALVFFALAFFAFRFLAMRLPLRLVYFSHRKTTRFAFPFRCQVTAEVDVGPRANLKACPAANAVFHLSRNFVPLLCEFSIVCPKLSIRIVCGKILATLRALSAIVAGHSIVTIISTRERVWFCQKPALLYLSFSPVTTTVNPTATKRPS